MYYTQFAEKRPLPANHGSTIEWRKWNTFERADKLIEGVIPEGQKFGMTKKTGAIAQYGTYAAISDRLETRAFDDVILGATEEMSASLSETQETLLRNSLLTGTNVLYCDNVDETGKVLSTPTSCATMAAGGTTGQGESATPNGWSKLTPTMINKAATILKKSKVKPINGKFVCIIHPSVAFDLRQDEAWIAAHQYAAATELFSGEIGELHGVRFVETTEAKIFCGADLAKNSRNLAVNGAVTNSATVSFDGGTVDSGSLAGRYVLIDGKRYKVLSNTGSAMTLAEAITAADNAVIYPGEGGAEGCAVYGCLFVGKGAYGVVDLSEGTEVIVKPRGSSGTADPLDQRSSVGWKGIHAAAILYDEYMVRVECGSSYSGEDKAN